MQIEIQISPKNKFLAGGEEVPLAEKGASWSESSLGPHAEDQGVYIIHHNGTIKYLGKTDGPSMTFGMRLRREFQESASQRKHIYPKLERLTVPPPIKVYILPTGEVRELVRASDTTLTDIQCIEILECALIQVFKPEFQT